MKLALLLTLCLLVSGCATFHSHPVVTPDPRDLVATEVPFV